MPFEISPEFKPETQVEVGPYQKYADALLRGCEVTRPAYGFAYSEALTEWLPFIKPAACALGAMIVGLGRDPSQPISDDEGYGRMWTAYFQRYGMPIQFDNDSRRMPREQIAERIAALR